MKQISGEQKQTKKTCKLVSALENQLIKLGEPSMKKLQIVKDMQIIFNTAGINDQQPSEQALATFFKMGPLNLKLLITNGWLKLQREQYSQQLIPIICRTSEDNFAHFGQITNDLEEGIAIRVGYGGKIFEGQFKQGNQFGWGRRILADGTYHVGWFKCGLAHGFGIGNAYTKGKGIRVGFYEVNKFIHPDDKVKFDQVGDKMRRFNLYEVGFITERSLEDHYKRLSLDKKSDTKFVENRSQTARKENKPPLVNKAPLAPVKKQFKSYREVQAKFSISSTIKPMRSLENITLQKKKDSLIYAPKKDNYCIKTKEFRTTA